MDHSFVSKVVNRANRTLLIWSIVGLLAVIGLLLLNTRYLYNFILGPFDIQAEQVLQVGSASTPQQYWVNVAGEDMINTGVTYTTTSSGGSKTIEASYFAMPVGEQLLLVRMNGDQSAETLPGNVTGWLSDVTSEETTKIIRDLEEQVPEVKGMFLPYKLETGNFRANGIIGMILGLGILVFSVWGLFTFVGRTTDPTTHPIFKKLSRFGPLDFTISRIETELASPHQTIGKLHLTNSWLIYEAATNLIATRYEDVVWAYMHVLRQKSYGVTVNKTYTAKVLDRFGVVCDFLAGRKEETVKEMLEAIYQHAPWTVMGYSDQLDAAWKKDRPGFLATVDQRKAQYAR
jgi:hypothetical protein